MPLMKIEGNVWTGTREQVLRSVVDVHNLPPWLTVEEVLEACEELGIVLSLVPEGYEWDGKEV